LAFDGQPQGFILKELEREEREGREKREGIKGDTAAAGSTACSPSEVEMSIQAGEESL
jgi:hypothetical protein